ncbi:extensin family protein [Chthonobacter albigriseus]|uniref:extensin-like domain-containing protein n=1 Tax=Chthonobacter albigriseus TaxID=1683161 RepID=UPI0015EE740D|nr:extensin family protein [Chthonobacter albigriseus]
MATLRRIGFAALLLAFSVPVSAATPLPPEKPADPPPAAEPPKPIPAPEPPAAPKPDPAPTAPEPPKPDPAPAAPEPVKPDAAPTAPEPPKPDPAPATPESQKPDTAPAAPADDAVRNVPADTPAPSTELACRLRLERLDVSFKPIPAIAEKDCAVEDPIEVTSVGQGIALEPAATLNCEAAESLARWVAEVVVPEAADHLKARPTAVAHASAYVCRPRNGKAGAKQSEHATGNAVDIASIAFAGRPAIPIEDDGSDDEEVRAFQKAIRTAACAYFTTVLGPGADQAHATHFHLDLQSRNNGYRICQ